MDSDEILYGHCIKSGNLINPRWLELKCREVQLEKVYCICVLWLCDSYEAVSFLCPWLRFDQESLIYDMLSSVVREAQTTAFALLLVEPIGICRFPVLCSSVAFLRMVYNLCNNSVTFMGCQGNKTRTSVVFLCKIEIQFIFISS